MAKTAKRGRSKPSLTDDILAGLHETLKYARGEKADVVIHRVVPSESKARKARVKLGLPRQAKRV